MDLAGELGLPKGTVHGLLRTLQSVGFVEQDSETGKYQLGAALLHMGSSYLDGNELRTRALNWSDSLAARTQEAVRIGTLHEEQVLIVLGTPSTVATISGEVFYYISQQASQTSFLPQKEIDRRVIAVYFDKSRRVQRLADYGIKDGKIFDFISRTIPTGGVEQNYLGFVFHIFKS